MTPDVSERRFEDAIQTALLAGGPDAPGTVGAVRQPVIRGYGEGAPGGYSRRTAKDYDAGLCLIPRDNLDFVLATQPKEWGKLTQHHGEDVKDKFLKRLAREIELRGALDVLRQGVKDSGCTFKLAYFHPSSGLNPETQRLFLANNLSVLRQFHYSSSNTKPCCDLGLFLNGIPIFTAELKNPLTGQTVEHAIKQYMYDRDPREPLFAFRRCLAHFAVDPNLVYFTTRLDRGKTRFYPFNQGKYGGAGNPPVSPTETGYATSYLWDRIWARDSVLNLVQHFVHEVEEEDDEGRRTGTKVLIFPRYHQLDCVRRLVSDARANGAGRNYLIQHSAGSGKSNTIAWLAHQLSVLHGSDDRRIFDSIVVVTDRRVLDRQLQGIVKQFEQTLGLVENIDTTSRQLKDALESGKTIIVTTLQKFPVIADQMSGLPGKRFALIIDEAHSSQSGEASRSLKQVLAPMSLEAAEAEEEQEEDLDDRVVDLIRRRGRLANVSTFAFTATPKPKTLELFGTPRPDGRFEAFSLYSMRQAIEEKFILDVLENYATYKVYWSLLKKAADDPHYDREKAAYLLRKFVDLHPHAIREKTEIIVEHFASQVAHRIAGRAKAMLVTRSRLHAVRFKRAIDAYLKERSLPFKAIVAFSGTVRDAGAEYTEAGMNGFPEAQTRGEFKRPEHRILVVAEKFQTGFDQPLLHTMYVDKKLGGVNAVQTLSRLNRVYPAKDETMVLDFANEADAIREAFQPYYERTLLAEATDPNLLYDLQRQVLDARVFDDAEVQRFAVAYFANQGTDRLYAVLEAPRARFEEFPVADQAAFRSKLTDYVRLYAFLSQVVRFADAALEKLYVFARLLRPYIPGTPDSLPLEVQEKIDMESYRLARTWEGKIGLARGNTDLAPLGPGALQQAVPEQLEPLSRIIKELNDRFGTDFTDEDKVFIQRLENQLGMSEALQAAVRANVPENARLTFDRVVSDQLQDMVDTNFKFYKRVTDDSAFAKFFLDWLFDRFRRVAEEEST
jgi:type I restriction enzyme R subunit